MELRKLFTVILLVFSLHACGQGNFFMWHGQDISYYSPFQFISILGTEEITNESVRVYCQDGSDIVNPILTRGICWHTGTNAPTCRAFTGDYVEGNFNDYITGLSAETKYYIQSYITTSQGIFYSNLDSITTPPIPMVTAWIEDPYLKVAHIYCPIGDKFTYTTAQINYGITTTGETIINSGLIYSSSVDVPDINSGSVLYTGITIGGLCLYVTGLSEGTTYNIRSFAQTNAGYTYSNIVTFRTLTNITVPSVGDSYGEGYIVSVEDVGDSYKCLVVSNIVNNGNALDWWDARRLVTNLGPNWYLPTLSNMIVTRNWLQSFTYPQAPPVSIPINKTYWNSNLRSRLGGMLDYSARVMYFGNQNDSYEVRASRDEYYAYGVKYAFIIK